MKGVYSSKGLITCGFPQSSILGPTLFLIYINGFGVSSDSFDFRLYADDSNLFNTFEKKDFIDLNSVSIKLKHVSKWCTANRLTMNFTKLN